MNKIALILAEADRRMKTVCYQDRNAAIHEVLMEIGLRLGEVMKNNHAGQAKKG